MRNAKGIKINNKKLTIDSDINSLDKFLESKVNNKDSGVYTFSLHLSYKFSNEEFFKLQSKVIQYAKLNKINITDFVQTEYNMKFTIDVSIPYIG